jgi:tyrosinase
LAITRKNAFTITTAEQDAFKNAVTAMVNDGTFGKFADIHKDMSHHMHTMVGDPQRVGTWRFLSWHRAYLIEMEQALRAKNGAVFIPYWKWEDGGVPSWLGSFKPTVNGVPNQRNTLSGPFTAKDGTTVKARFPTLMTINDYFDFSYGLEVFPHNRGHVVLGPPMLNVPTAPCDPIFYMHHAEVDRWWAEWQKKNPGKKPVLTGSDAVMDPWKHTADSVHDISKLSASSVYSYL